MKKGIYSALINTFDEKGAPALEPFYGVIEHNIKVCGVSGLYVNGSTGENFIMPHEYKKIFLREAAKAVQGRVSMVAQVGCNVVEEVYELAALAGEYGYDAISAITPFYYKFGLDEIMNYYFALADRSPLPLIVYNIPIRTGVALTKDDFARLFTHKNIIGVKFTANDFYLLERVRSEFPDKIIFSGFDEMLLSAAVLGTDGAIGSTYNICGNLAQKVFEAVGKSDLAEANKYQSMVNTIVEMLFKTDLMPTVKAVYRYYGIEAGSCRPPMLQNGEAQYANAKAVYDFIEANK